MMLCLHRLVWSYYSGAMNWVCDNIDMVKDCYFLRRENIYSRISSAITDNADKDLKEELRSLKMSHEVSVLGRGSYGFKTMSLYSDIDLLIIVDNSSTYEAEYSLLSVSIKRRVSIKIVCRDYFRKNNLSLSMLFNYNSMRYIYGNIDISKDFLRLLRSIIISLNIATLEKLWVRDVNRGVSDRDANSPHYYSIKRGVGCLIDIEYCNLLIYIAKENGILLPASLISKVDNLYRYFITLKHFLHVRYRSPMESFECLFVDQKSDTPSIPRCFHKNKVEKARVNVIRAISSITLYIKSNESKE